MSEIKGLQQKLLNLGTEKIQELVGELMKSEKFQAAAATAATQAMQAKGRFDKNMQLLLGLLNLPSKKDLRRVNEKIESLNGKIVALTAKIDRLAEQEGSAKRAKK
jgi:hypothetical protein